MSDRRLSWPALGALATVFAGCAATGLGQGVRADVRARMATLEQPVARCYEEALKRNRKLRGSMLVAFVAASGTGKFSDVRVVRSDVADPDLERCVVEQVSSLTLTAPQKSQIAVEYPFEFAYVD